MAAKGCRPTGRMRLYRYTWGNNRKRKRLKGRICQIVKTGTKNSVQVTFRDTGEMEIVSRRALRKVPQGGQDGNDTDQG